MNAPFTPMHLPPSLLAQGELVELRARDLRAPDEYARARQGLRRTARLVRRLRRVELGARCTLLFENAVTVAAQLEEVRFLEGQGWSDDRLERELDVYRPLLPRAGELCATLFVHDGDLEFGEALVRGLAGESRALGLRVGGHDCVAETVDALLDPMSPVLYVRFRLPAAAQRALLTSDDDVTAWLCAGEHAALARLNAHTRLELERDVWRGRRR